MASEAVVARAASAAQDKAGVSGVRFLGTRATEASLAAELAEERHIVLQLQRAILPLHDTPFDLPGLRTVVRYLPASSAGRVGGDWYITAEMPDGNVLLAIGDVGGHGLEAAAGMARLRGALAGHPPPVLVRGAWALPIERPAGILLGAGKDPYELSGLKLRPGDLLLL